MTPHTITPAVGTVCHCKAKAGFRRSPRGFHTRTRISSLLGFNLDSSLKMTWFHSSAVQFSRESPRVAEQCDVNINQSNQPVFSCAVPLQTEASMGGRQRQHT
ncbi:e3 ubiquitin-protein ligase RNF13 [Trichonephila clavipes]|nr:e3 ubiquitin-protein ligase RNF13 [Trichonephila clavipes]